METLCNKHQMNKIHGPIAEAYLLQWTWGWAPNRNTHMRERETSPCFQLPHFQILMCVCLKAQTSSKKEGGVSLCQGGSSAVV